MMDRPEEFQYAWHYGVVRAVYPESWEVDVAAEGGGIVQRVLVLGPRLPEVSTPDRPQWVMWGTGAARAGAPVCIPISSRLPATRTPRKDVVYYEEVGNYRVTITRANELEIRNLDGEAQHRITIQQEDGIVQLDTPHTRITLRESDQSITVEAGQPITIEAGTHCNVSCETARIDARLTAEVVAPDVRLGEPATQQIPLGNALVAYLAGLVAQLNGHTHQDAGAVNSGAFAAPTAALLSLTSKTR